MSWRSFKCLSFVFSRVCDVYYRDVKRRSLHVWYSILNECTLIMWVHKNRIKTSISSPNKTPQWETLKKHIKITVTKPTTIALCLNALYYSLRLIAMDLWCILVDILCISLVFSSRISSFSPRSKILSKFYVIMFLVLFNELITFFIESASSEL